MRRGFLSHHCCCGDTAYTLHTATLSEQNILLDMQPFASETANTRFYDELLIIVDHTFHTEIELFIDRLMQQLESDTAPTMQLILNNEIYRRHPARIGSACSIYAIDGIDRTTQRPTVTNSIKISSI